MHYNVLTHTYIHAYICTCIHNTYVHKCKNKKNNIDVDIWRCRCCCHHCRLSTSLLSFQSTDIFSHISSASMPISLPLTQHPSQPSHIPLLLGFWVLYLLLRHHFFAYNNNSNNSNNSNRTHWKLCQKLTNKTFY